MPTPKTRVPRRTVSLPVIEGTGLTHAGLIRERNEDSILTDPTGVLWAVADGMGGYGHGDVASDIVTGALATIPDDSDARQSLPASLTSANTEVHLAAREKGSQMGATVVAMMIQHVIAHVAWVGDSRAYLLRGGRLRLLTHDHTVVQGLVDDGVLSADAANHHPDSHIVTRAIGAAAEIEIDWTEVPLTAGDRLMLCSDGLTGCVGDRAISAALAAAPTPEAACRALLGNALEAGAPDNVSVISVFLSED